MRLRSRFDAVPQARQPQITGRLRSVPGPVQPTLDDRKRQEASAFTWACVTGGGPRFAPRPIEEMQPEQVRRTWIARRGSTWWQLTRPDPLNYYAELRKLLIEHARHLAGRIDSSTEGIPLIPPRCEARVAVVTGLFIWLRIDDQRQRSFVTA